MKNNAILKQACLMICALLLLSACGDDHIPYGEYRIEWDESDPKLHGQEVQFKVPMAYVVLHESEIGVYIKEEVGIGRLLNSVGLSASLFPGYQTERINEGMTFTVKASYWYRTDWYVKGFVGDSRYVIFVDENGVESQGSFVLFSMYSNQPHLAELKNEGEYK